MAADPGRDICISELFAWSSVSLGMELGPPGLKPEIHISSVSAGMKTRSPGLKSGAGTIQFANQNVCVVVSFFGNGIGHQAKARNSYIERSSGFENPLLRTESAQQVACPSESLVFTALKSRQHIECGIVGSYGLR